MQTTGKGYNLQIVAEITGGELSGSLVHYVKHLAIDSRSVDGNAQTLFFCIRGPRNDGHHYIRELYNKGIRAFVVEQLPASNYPDAAFVHVQNSIEALQKLAAYHRSTFNGELIGITGSNGKTIVKEWLAHCLASDFNLVRNPKSYNSQVGVPLSVWNLQPDSELCVFEAGISFPGEMEKLEQILKPTIGVFTMLGDAHQENFKSHHQKATEKAILFKGAKAIVYRKDHAIIHDVITNQFVGKKFITWSTEDKDVFVYAFRVIRETHFTRIDYRVKNQSFSLQIPFIDEASVENALHVVTLLHFMDISFERIRQSMETLPPVAMRLELLKGVHSSTLINDSYNSDINSLTIALDFLNMQSQHKKKSLILSDILQSGVSDDLLCQQVAQLIQDKKIDSFYGIGPVLQKNSRVFKGQAGFFKTSAEFIEKINPERFANHAILLKGARRFAFERIASLLEERAHKTILEINLNHMVHNLNFYKSLLHAETKVMVMLKAFAYGSGTYEVANVLQHHHVDYFGVAFIDEGITLRNAGIKTPIMVMSPEPTAFETMISYDLEPEIFSFDRLKAFASALDKQNKSEYPVHIKIDTGMHRLGFAPEQVDELCTVLNAHRRIKVQSVFSHLAGSDDPQFDEFTEQQVYRFAHCLEILKARISYPFITHILNSAGIERFPNHQMDMVRLGIGLYGVGQVYQEQLKNVSTLKSRIVQVKDVPASETIGYSRKGKLKTDGKIAIVPVGYADGLNRLLSNGKGYFKVRNQRAPIIGNVCMDLTMIDVSSIPVHENEEVIIFGDDPNARDLANILNTIPYEIFTSISPRVKRVYLHE